MAGMKHETKARIEQAVRRSLKRARPDRPRGMAGWTPRKGAAERGLEEEAAAGRGELDLEPRAGGGEG